MRKYSKAIIISAAVALIICPVLILAKSDKVCEAISQIQSRIEQKITQRQDQLTAKQDDINSRYKEIVQNREAALEQERKKWDENRQEHFAKLEEKAQTNEQKQAVTKFEEAISKAVEDRRSAFDQAILDFQEGLNSVHQSRLGILDNAILDYKDGVAQAFEQAQQTCDALKLRQGLQNVRSQYRQDVKQFQGNGAQIQDLVEAKKQAMNEAKDKFQQDLDQALQDLKVSFPQTE
jgi:hypothetical protein